MATTNTTFREKPANTFKIFSKSLENTCKNKDVVLIADVVKQIVPSEETSNEIFQKTTQFEMESINGKDFRSTAQKYGYEN